MRFSATLVIAALLLWGVFFLKFGVFLLLALGVAAGAFYVRISSELRIDRLGAVVALNFLYWLFSGLLIGGIQPADFVSPSFFQGDGRIFVYYIPLLFFSVVAVSRRDIDQAVLLVAAMAVAVLLLLVVWAPTKLGPLSGGKAGLFFGLLTSHTGAGTFFGFLSVFLTIYGIERRHRWYILLGGLSVLPVFASASRATLVGMALVGAWYLWRRRNVRTLAAAALAGIIVIASMPFVAPHTWNRTAAVFSWSLIQNARQAVSGSTWQPGEEQEFKGKEFNVLSRLLFYAYASRRFFESPLIGIGFGRYNDHGLTMSGAKGYLYVATGGDRKISVANAHNSVLHVAAENGILGLFLLGWLWVAMYRRLGRAGDLLTADGNLKAYLTACQGLILFTFAAAMFGHSLAAPSVGIPVLTLVGLGIAYHRSNPQARAYQGPTPFNPTTVEA